jgi:diacylglycerol kinase (ATP)
MKIPRQSKNQFEDPLAQKSRTGLSRLWHATTYSLNGLRLGWGETAFRQEVLIAVFLIPLAFFIAQDWSVRVILIASVLLVLVVELLNTAIESVVDLCSPEWHSLAKRAKDLASAAVLISLCTAVVVWGSAIWIRFFSN